MDGQIRETEFDIHARIAAAINALDPTLAARPGEDSPGIYNVRVRLAPRLAATFGQDIKWGGNVHVADGREGYEWQYLDRDCDAFGFDAPSLDFDGTAATNPVYEDEGVKPVPVTDETISQAALAIVKESHRVRGEHAPADAGGDAAERGHEYLELWRDVENPKPDRRRAHDWRARERFARGTRFVLRVAAGEQPALYPVGGFSHQAAPPSSALFAALLPSLTTSWPSLREIFALEGGDPFDVLARLVGDNVVGYEYVLETMRALKDEEGGEEDAEGVLA